MEKIVYEKVDMKKRKKRIEAISFIMVLVFFAYLGLVSLSDRLQGLVEATGDISEFYVFVATTTISLLCLLNVYGISYMISSIFIKKCRRIKGGKEDGRGRNKKSREERS